MDGAARASGVEAKVELPVVGGTFEGIVTKAGFDALTSIEMLEGLNHRFEVEQRGLKADRFQGTARYVIEYLAAEVLDSQPPPIPQYVLHTAILDRFCPPLCQAESKGKAGDPNSFTEVGPKLDGQQFLEWLLSANLFVIPLELAGYEVYELPMAHLFRELALKWPTSALQELVPNA